MIKFIFTQMRKLHIHTFTQCVNFIFTQNVKLQKDEIYTLLLLLYTPLRKCVKVFFHAVTKSNIDQLHKLHQKAARYVKRFNKKVPDDQVLSVAGWKSFDLMYKQQIACLTYKLYTNNLPEPLSVWKSHTRNQRSLRNRHRVDLPKFNKISYKKSWAYRSAMIWNQLSNNCTEATSLSIFKSKLKKELNTLSFCPGIVRGRDENFIYY